MSRVSNRVPHVVWHWGTMGPYHFARMRALAAYSSVFRLSVLETSDRDAHSWVRPVQSLPFSLLTLNGGGPPGESIVQALRELKPDVIVTTGYHDPIAHAAYSRYRSANPNAKLVLWSESTEHDHSRSRLRELLKRVVAARHSAAIAAGEEHARYLRNLGFSSESIVVSGDCIDNEHFSRSAQAAWVPSHERSSIGLPERYFLYVGRLAPEKNLFRLLEAYRRYRALNATAEPASLVLVGDGPDRAGLESEIKSSGLPGVTLAGTKQIDELPRFYANSECLILPSIREPWGLVVNEAMACGRPVLASSRCGCAPELIREGVTGFTFDPLDAEAIAQCMYQLTCLPDLDRLGKQAAAHVGGFTVERFAASASECLVRLCALPCPNATPFRLLGQRCFNFAWLFADRLT
jgi:1,2-diacylglycerol 3-alpha-glucosyltransferase